LGRPSRKARLNSSSPALFRSGLIYGIVAYLWWGFVPLYFRQILQVPASEILAHRIVWSIVLMVILSALLNLWPQLLSVLRSPKLIATLLLSAVLLALNWLLYIYATNTGRVTEAGLGYYMMPLVNAFFATLFLGEKLRPAHYPALALIVIGVSIPFIIAQDFTWLAIALPITFGLYSLVRKVVAVESLVGLTIETMLLAPISLGYLLWRGYNGVGSFGPDITLNSWLIFSGVVTVVPLLTFTLSIRRLPLLANSLIQFLSPTMQVLVAVFILKEEIPPARWPAIIAVWLAVLIFIGDALWQGYQTRQARLSLQPAS
jgi:chloramphenicol-sensitive protein RarD